jgi:alpha-tubulin suppressor-like RCC1 family protein
VPGLDDVVAVAAGSLHTVVLKSDRTVWSWGYNMYTVGLLGAGLTDFHRASPVQVLQSSGSPLTDVVAIAAGAQHTLALKAEGSVWVWGNGYYGALGQGNTTNQSRAVQVPGLSGVTRIVAGGFHSLALRTHGTAAGQLWAWGYNTGELGDTATRLSPALICDQVAAFGAGVSQTFLQKADGSLWASGLNELGQLGNGTTQSPQIGLAPALGGLGALTKISGSSAHTLALTAAGEVWGTGNNEKGAVGDGTVVNKASPTRAVLLSDIVDVAAGLANHSVYQPPINHSVALTGDGRVWTWGSNQYVALGHGNTVYDHVYRPQPIDGFSTADRGWPEGDPDGDGLLTQEEIVLGTDPFNADTNGDGLSDSAAARSGVSPTAGDVDGDSLANAAERAAGTDPLRADTDSDGVADNLDCFPLDPTRSTCPQPQPGDVTPPLINLLEPVSAVLLSSLP